MRRLILVLALPFVLAPSAARALDLHEVSCVCNDQARSSGDREACFALLTRRLVANGSLSQSERARLLVAPPPAPPDCGLPGGGVDDRAYGLAVQVDRAFAEPGGRVRAELLAWNLSSEPAVIQWPQQSERGCWWDLRIRDGSGTLRHQYLPPCGDAVSELVIAPGDTWSRALDLDLVALSSDAGEPDGTPLPPGHYWIEASLVDSTGDPFGPAAQIPIQVE